MESLIGLVNTIQRACTALGDYGGANSALSSLWEALPSVAVVGGQSSGKSSVLESIVGRDFLPRGSGIVTRRPLVLQLHKTENGTEDYAEFLHLTNKKFTNFSLVRKEIEDETDRITGKNKQISPVPIHLSIFSPNVVNLTLIDLPGLTKVAVEGQPETIVHDIESMVRSYVVKPNCLILAISPANQDIATSDAIKLAREVDPTGDRTFGVLTKLDLMDKGTNALDVIEGRSYRLQYPWVGIVNRSQADINNNVDMMVARRKEGEYFETSPDYGHLATRMGSEYLAKLLSKLLESVIRSRLPSILSLINKNIEELEKELDQLGRPVAIDAGAQLYTILGMCRAFEKIFKEHLDGGRPGGARIYGIFDNNLPAAIRKLPFDRHLSLESVKKIVSESDGYQPHLIAPESGYRRLIEGSLNHFRGPAEASVNVAQLYTILGMCRAFEKIFKEHLDGGRPGGARIYGIFDNNLPAAIRKLPFDRHLSLESVKKIVSESDGYQPHLIAPESGYRRLIEGSLNHFRGPAEASVNAVHFILKELVRKSIAETEELRRFPSLQIELVAAANSSLDKFREESMKSVVRLVDMESSYLTVDFFRKLQVESQTGSLSSPTTTDQYGEGHFRKIASNVAAYIKMVAQTLVSTIPKAVVHCQVRQAKLSLLNYFYAQISQSQGKRLGQLIDENPALMDRRVQCAKRLELYKKARDEIDAVVWVR